MFNTPRVIGSILTERSQCPARLLVDSLLQWPLSSTTVTEYQLSTVTGEVLVVHSTQYTIRFWAFLHPPLVRFYVTHLCVSLPNMFPVPTVRVFRLFPPVCMLGWPKIKTTEMKTTKMEMNKMERRVICNSDIFKNETPSFFSSANKVMPICVCVFVFPSFRLSGLFFQASNWMIYWLLTVVLAPYLSK